MTILNLTQHMATAEQVAAGVVEPHDKAAVQSALTFSTLPTLGEVAARAARLAAVVREHDVGGVMIGGAPYLMAPLEAAIRELGRGYTILYSFSERVSSHQVQPDGTVQKTQTFRHAGWVEAADTGTGTTLLLRHAKQLRDVLSRLLDGPVRHKDLQEARLLLLEPEDLKD